LGDPWTSRNFGGFGFRFGPLFPCLADRPRGACGLSAWRSSSTCSSCSSRVLGHFGFDPVGRAFLTGGCLADRPPERRGLSVRHELLADRLRMWYGPSACGGAGWVVLLVFNGPSAVWRGLSVWWSRTVRPRASDRPPGLLQISEVLCFLVRASSLGSFGVCSYGWYVRCDYVTLANSCANPWL
jgi:hypothetical protein